MNPLTVRAKIVRGKPKGHYLQFFDGEYLIGRARECHVRPNSELVSRRHCLMRIDGSHVGVRDLGSTHGTFVNGNRLIDERALIHGDLLQLGPVVLQVVLFDDVTEPSNGSRREIPECGGWLWQKYVKGVGWVFDGEARHYALPTYDRLSNGAPRESRGLWGCTLVSTPQTGMTDIIACPGCHRRLLSPIDQCVRMVCCPKCGHAWNLLSNQPGKPFRGSDTHGDRALNGLKDILADGAGTKLWDDGKGKKPQGRDPRYKACHETAIHADSGNVGRDLELMANELAAELGRRGAAYTHEGVLSYVRTAHRYGFVGKAWEHVAARCHRQSCGPVAGGELA